MARAAILYLEKVTDREKQARKRFAERKWSSLEEMIEGHAAEALAQAKTDFQEERDGPAARHRTRCRRAIQTGSRCCGAATSASCCGSCTAASGR